MAHQMSLSWVQDRAWRASARGHEVIADSSLEHGGSDRGMSPGELLVAAVGTCMALDLSYYAERHPGLDLSTVRFDLTWEDAPEKPSRIGRIQGMVSLPGDLPPEVKIAVTRVLDSCKIRRTLEHGATVEIDVHFDT